MIMEASIGIGIQGKEGIQAVRSSDYSIGQFKFLEKLILFYGRNGYTKIAKYISYYFYKNFILVVTELIFLFIMVSVDKFFFQIGMEQCSMPFLHHGHAFLFLHTKKNCLLKFAKNFQFYIGQAQKITILISRLFGPILCMHYFILFCALLFLHMD